jgi:hypothetical protein
MKRSAFFLLLLAAAAPLISSAEQLIPAGSLIQCTVSEPKLSSKTAAIGDPVLCQVSHVEKYGRSTFPYGAYLVGRFEDYKDPGHFVGKGWMELKFDRMVVQDQVVPLEAKVVYVPGYNVSRDGRILGKGHAVRDTIEWMIPVLWPIDLINLPRRGPRPVLKEETRLTLKVMDDFGVPDMQEQQHDAYGFAHRQPTEYAPPPPPAPAPAPIVYNNYITPPPTYVAPPAPVVVYRPAPVVLVMRGGYGFVTSNYWPVGGYQIRYLMPNGAPAVMPMNQLDIAATFEANRRRGVNFSLPGY